MIPAAGGARPSSTPPASAGSPPTAPSANTRRRSGGCRSAEVRSDVRPPRQAMKGARGAMKIVPIGVEGDEQRDADQGARVGEDRHVEHDEGPSEDGPAALGGADRGAQGPDLVLEEVDAE